MRAISDEPEPDASQPTTKQETKPYVPVDSIPGIKKTQDDANPILDHAWAKDVFEKFVEPDHDLKSAWESLRNAEFHFKQRGFVGRGYFLTKWRDDAFNIDIMRREILLKKLIEIGLVEQYTVDGTTALRTTTADQTPA